MPGILDSLLRKWPIEITCMEVGRLGLGVPYGYKRVHGGDHCVRTVKNRTTVTAAAAT